MDSNIGKRGQHVSRMKWRNVTTKLVVESSIKERKLVLRIEVGKDLEDVCEPEEKTDQYSLFVLLFFFFSFACRQRPLQWSWREFQLLQMMR